MKRTLKKEFNENLKSLTFEAYVVGYIFVYGLDIRCCLWVILCLNSK
jgi:hypothetical protein